MKELTLIMASVALMVLSVVTNPSIREIRTILEENQRILVQVETLSACRQSK